MFQNISAHNALRTFLQFRLLLCYRSRLLGAQSHTATDKRSATLTDTQTVLLQTQHHQSLKPVLTHPLLQTPPDLAYSPCYYWLMILLNQAAVTSA